MVFKRELWKIRKRLDNVVAELSAIKTILNQYFTREEQAIIFYEASIGRNDTMLDKLNVKERKSYAAACREYLRFGREVEACLAGELERRTAVRLGKVPAILEETGCERKDMYITQKHLRNILHTSSKVNTHYHDIDIKQFKQLPELLEEPLVVLSSKKDKDTIVVVLNATDKQGNQLIVPMNKAGKAFYQGENVEANFVLSAYGKKNIAHYLEQAGEEEKILYVDKKISTRLGEVSLQLRQFLSTDTYINMIPQKHQNVNTFDEKNIEAANKDSEKKKINISL